MWKCRAQFDVWRCYLTSVQFRYKCLDMVFKNDIEMDNVISKHVFKWTYKQQYTKTDKYNNQKHDHDDYYLRCS